MGGGKVNQINEIAHRAIKKWGIDAQLDMVQEECAELIVAINKSRRQLPVDITGEIADVLIMCEQASIIFGEEEVRNRLGEKLERLKGRLDIGSRCIVRYQEDDNLTGIFLGVVDGRATVKVDGYACSDTFPMEQVEILP
jgi:NTP pyrophosphatase (non-canonical NTP hydrolase)